MLDQQEIQEIKHYKEKIYKEYKESIKLKDQMDKEIEAKKVEMEEIKEKRDISLATMNIECANKQEELKTYIESKEKFIRNLDDRKAEIKERTKKLDHEFGQIQGWKERQIKGENDIKEARAELQAKMDEFEEKTKDITIVLFKVKQKHEESQEYLAESKETLAKAEKALEKQLKDIKILEDIKNNLKNNLKK